MSVHPFPPLGRTIRTAAVAAVLAALMAVPVPAAAAQGQPTLSFTNHATTLVAGETATVHEGRSVSRWIEIQIDVSPPATENTYVEIEIDTDSSTATPDRDFTWPSRTRTLSLRAGQSQISTMFGPSADRTAEGEETVVLRMVAVDHAPYTIDSGKDTQRITILDTSRPLAPSADPDRGLRISHYNLPIIEGTSATYTVALASQPSHPVTLAPLVRTSGNDPITVTPASRTFSPQNWSTAQQFTVTVPAGDYDTDKNSLVIDHVATSLDDDYNSAGSFNGPGLHKYLTVTVTEPRPQQPDDSSPQEPDETEPQGPRNPWLAISGPAQPHQTETSTDTETPAAPQQAGPGPHGPVQNLTATLRGSDRIKVQWDPLTDDSQVIRYIVTLQRDGAEDKVRRPGPRKTRLIYRNLQTGTYTITVAVKTADGLGPAATTQISLGP